MNLSQIILFLGVIVVYRLLFDQKAKIWIIMTASIFGVFWLQSALLIRNFDYWFPFISITLIIITWLVITPKEMVKTKDNAIAFLIIIAFSLIIPLSRFLPIDIKISPTSPPQLSFVIIAVLLLFSICSIVINVKQNLNGTILPNIILFLILITFIFLKTPILNSKMSLFLKMISGQTTGSLEAQGSDLRWLGFSYIAFRLIHTLRDFQFKRYRSINLCTYISYILFFPALIAGPIDRVEHFEKEITQETQKNHDFIIGGKRLMIGFLRKFVIADTLALFALSANNAMLVKNPFWLWIMLIAYALMIYFDFSGYTDIALGLSACIGITLPENFDHPYLAQNLTLFWNRWHMSLTQWFRAYFFNPFTRFLRSRKQKFSSTVIIAVTQISTMTLIGLWHGISWNFVFWGLWHGTGLFIHNRWVFIVQKIREKNGEKTPNLKIHNYLSKVSVIFTFFFVAIGWIWFVFPDPQTSIQIFKRLIGIY
jgi:alginate O-acetyltransferase complex protein AlgI